MSELKFTEEQEKFIKTKSKKSIIFSATAGSGKTFCSIQRLKELIKRGVNPKKIIFFSFTNAAVEELKNRVQNSDVRITTIHSFCVWMLHRMGKSRDIISFENFIDWYKNKNYPKEGATEKEILNFEKLISNLYDDSSFYESKITNYKLQKIEGGDILELPDFYNEYINFLNSEEKMDFSDILLDAKESLRDNKWLNMFKNKYDYVFIDEYQDTSPLQMEILLKLNARTYYLIGDLNQSIYGYSGSDHKTIESMLEKRRSVEKMTLTTNFRSAKEIVENSNKFSSLDATAFNDFSGRVFDKFIDYNQVIKLIKNNEEVAVLARTNYIVKYIEFQFLRRKVPINYTNYFKPKDIEDIKKGNINILVQKRIDSILTHFKGDLSDLIKFIDSNRDKKSLITTIHKSKGKEYDICVVTNSFPPKLLEYNNIELPDNKKELYSFYEGSENYQEEKNIHYVAVSRPKKDLYYMLLDLGQ
jgi:superfamily I DNA/RNA helicase